MRRRSLRSSGKLLLAVAVAAAVFNISPILNAGDIYYGGQPNAAAPTPYAPAPTPVPYPYPAGTTYPAALPGVTYAQPASPYAVPALPYAPPAVPGAIPPTGLTWPANSYANQSAANQALNPIYPAPAAAYAPPVVPYAAPAAVYDAPSLPAVTPYVNPPAPAALVAPVASAQSTGATYLYPNPATLAHTAAAVTPGTAVVVSAVNGAVTSPGYGAAAPTAGLTSSPYQPAYAEGITSASSDPYASIGSFVDYQAYLEQKADPPAPSGATALPFGSPPAPISASLTPADSSSLDQSPASNPGASLSAPPAAGFTAAPPVLTLPPSLAPDRAAEPAAPATPVMREEIKTAAPAGRAAATASAAEPEREPPAEKAGVQPPASVTASRPPAAPPASPVAPPAEREQVTAGTPVALPPPVSSASTTAAKIPADSVLSPEAEKETATAGDNDDAMPTAPIASVPPQAPSQAGLKPAAAPLPPPPAAAALPPRDDDSPPPVELPAERRESPPAAATAPVMPPEPEPPSLRNVPPLPPASPTPAGEAPVAGIAVNVHQPEDEPEDSPVASPDTDTDTESEAESDAESDADPAQDDLFTQGKAPLSFPVPLPPPQELTRPTPAPAPQREPPPPPAAPRGEPRAAAPAPAVPSPAFPTYLESAAATQPAAQTFSVRVPIIAPDAAPTVGLAELGSSRALDGTPLPPPPLPELPATKPEPALPAPDLDLVRSDFNRLKTYCEEESLGSAAEVFARMPDFGKDEEINRLRANAANLLILALSRGDNLGAARRIYESVPVEPVGYEASLAKARAIINLTTYYVRAERWNDAYSVLMDIGKIPHRSALNNELFRLMARMIPYLDNAEETGKAQTIFELLLREVNSPGAAALFAENAPGIFKYYLHYVDKTESPPRRRKRLDFLEFAFAELEKFSANPDMAKSRKQLGEALAERYAGDPDRAAKFYLE